jgi:hypothetical protein
MAPAMNFLGGIKMLGASGSQLPGMECGARRATESCIELIIDVESNTWNALNLKENFERRNSPRCCILLFSKVASQSVEVADKDDSRKPLRESYGGDRHLLRSSL